MCFKCGSEIILVEYPLLCLSGVMSEESLTVAEYASKLVQKAVSRHWNTIVNPMRASAGGLYGSYTKAGA